MKTPLKSLKIIKEMYEHFVKTYRELEPKLMICEKEDFDNVETALKDYEMMKQTKIITVNKDVSDDDLEKLKNQRSFICSSGESKVELLFDNETQKKLKAFEIIKEKKVDVTYIIEHPEEKDVIWYNSRFMGVLCEGWRMLSQAEYNLLKEVLL